MNYEKDQKLVAELKKILSNAHSMSLGEISKNCPALYKCRKTPEEEKNIETIFVKSAEDIIEAVKACGYSLPSQGDLRAQLLALGRALKSHSFCAGYSGDGSIETQISDSKNEMKAEVKSEIGYMILDALCD